MGAMQSSSSPQSIMEKKCLRTVCQVLRCEDVRIWLQGYESNFNVKHCHSTAKNSRALKMKINNQKGRWWLMEEQGETGEIPLVLK